MHYLRQVAPSPNPRTEDHGPGGTLGIWFIGARGSLATTATIGLSALAAHLRQMASDETSISEAAAEYAHDIVLGLERGMAARDDGTLPPGQVHDVHFTAFLADPIGAIRRLYDALGRELSPAAEQRMTAFLAAHPGDGGGAGHRYSWADTGLDADEVRERCAPYQERFEVEAERVA